MKKSVRDRCKQVRYFRCDVCGAESPATKWGNKTAVGHKKTMYCFMCKAERMHTQTE